MSEEVVKDLDAKSSKHSNNEIEIDLEMFLKILSLGKWVKSQFIPVPVEKGGMAKKLALAAPYNMFLTAIPDSKPTHQEPLTITMQEIFDKSLGEIESSVQISFEIDITWLTAHYHYAGILDKPLLILYGADMPELQEIGKLKSQITAIQIKMASKFAAAHAKIMLLGYTDGSMRIVILTANLQESDWHFTQSLWMSPLLAKLPENADSTDGESPTGFKADLIQFLLDYEVTQLDAWIDRIRKTDFSAINVFLIPSVPGAHAAWGSGWGCERLGFVLSKHATPIDDNIPVVCQSSSIGSLGPSVRAWVQRDLIRNLRKSSARFTYNRKAFVPFKMIHPSFRNVQGSHNGIKGGASPYPKEFHDRQPWLRDHLQQWKSSARHRSQAMPHNKCYARFNEEEQCLYWFLLTSANVSKVAWGISNRDSRRLQISNYEAGVLFLPRFVTGEETFPLGNDRNGVPAFPMPYDVPLTPYEPDDAPYVGALIEEWLKAQA